MPDSTSNSHRLRLSLLLQVHLVYNVAAGGVVSHQLLHHQADHPHVVHVPGNFQRGEFGLEFSPGDELLVGIHDAGVHRGLGVVAN